MNFGSQTLAEEISILANDYEALDAHPDWENVGSGSYRFVFLHKPSNLVYKVEDNRWNQHDRKGMDNRTEHETATALRMLVWCHVYIPRTALFETTNGCVIAMEYIEGVRHSYGSRPHKRGRMELYLRGQLGDMHTGNYLVVGDNIVPIDLASSCRKADRRLIGDMDDDCNTWS